MSQIQYLKIEAPDDYDMANISEDIISGNIEHLNLMIHNSYETFGTPKAEADWLLKVGITKALNTDGVLEHLVTPRTSQTDTSVIIEILLEQIVKTNHLIIIENYIFNSTDHINYPNFLLSCISKFVPSLKKITFIYTNDNRYVKDPVKNQLDSLIKSINNSILIEYKQTDLFHDRFFLADPSGMGLIIGASLNNLGQKYCVMDYLQPRDNADLYTELRTNRLI